MIIFTHLNFGALSIFEAAELDLHYFAISIK